MKNLIYKALSCLICISLITTLFAAVSFAATETIWNATVQIYTPVDNETIAFYAHSNDDSYEVNDNYAYDNFIAGVRVYDLTSQKYYDTDDLVIAGHQYKFEVLLTPNNGYSFSDYNGTPNLNAVFRSFGLGINELSADVEWFPDKRSIIMSYVYVVNEREIIDNVSISVTAPADGDYPAYTSSIQTENVNVNSNFDDGEYVINGIKWHLLPADDPYSSGEAINKDEAFEGGRTYRLYLDIVAVQDYAEGIERVFDFEYSPNYKNNHVIVNGSNTYTYTSHYSPENTVASDNCLTIYRDFYCPYRKHISEVALEIDPPMLGEHPDFTALAAVPDYKVVAQPDDTGFINGVKWHNNSTGENLTEDDVFMPDTSYSFVAYLEPIDNNTIFNKDSSGNTTVTGALNGNEADIYNGIIVNQNSSYAISLEYRFEPLSNVLSRIAVLDIDEPLAGQTPDYEGTVINEKFYQFDKSLDDGNTIINGIQWHDATEDRVMEKTDTFQVGSYYQIYVNVTVPKEYSFNSSTTYAINDFEVSLALSLAGTNNLTLIYDFQEVEPYQSEYNYATGITIPQEGATPDFTAALANNESRIESVKWYDASSMTPVSLTANDKFVGGHTYKVELTLSPAENYAFATNAEADLTYRFGFEFADGGYTVIYDGAVDGDKNTVIVTYTFDAIPINNIDISLDKPLPGFSPSFIAYPGNNACNASSITWYDKTDDVYIEEADYYEFIEGHTYVATVDVFTVGNASFNVSDNSFKATINNNSAERELVYYWDDESDMMLYYSPYSAIRLSCEFECVPENILTVECDNHTGSVAVAHEIYSSFEENSVAVYIAFYDSRSALASVVVKDVQWANDIYGENPPENAVRCKAMLWNKNTLEPLCDAAECEIVREY